MLPAFSMAAGMIVAEPCPMSQMSSDASHDDACCVHMDNVHLDKKFGMATKAPCKAGQECSTGGALHTVVVKALVPLHPFSQHLLIPAPVKPEPANLWRPPRYV